MASATSRSSLIHSYNRLPVSFVRGEGTRLWDDQGNEYLDALGGIAVCALGHCHPHVTAAINEQAQTLLHTSNLFAIENQEKLATKLCELTGMEAVFFCNSGAEANEAAIKISRLFAQQKQITNPRVIAFHGSFHGRTMATLSATGNEAVHNGFHPLLESFLHLPYNDVSAIEQAATEHNDIVAIIVEPILGEGGVVVPDDGYLSALRSICDSNGWLLIADEIQTGAGRTGHWYASLGQGVRPDVITSAKALGNGIPIGACLTQGIASTLIKPGHHGTTFGGNPFATRVALSVLEAMQQEDLLTRASNAGLQLQNKLRDALHNRPEVTDIRGRGMMIGISLDIDCTGLVNLGLENRVVFNVAAGNVIRLLPPYNITDAEINEIVRRIADSVNELCQNQETDDPAGNE
ncbi:acetylornithine aminotransferase [Chromatiales bacterium (ex Bugula neritina AB1)]|nr:acetylornithine aminotransferase [Chromatiales bacterium (ex Bugula neritina AB1)]